MIWHSLHVHNMLQRGGQMEEENTVQKWQWEMAVLQDVGSSHMCLERWDGF